MIVKKGSISLATLDCLRTLGSSARFPNTSLIFSSHHCTTTRAERCRGYHAHQRDRVVPSWQHGRRGYATLTGDGACSHLTWPDPPRGHTHPTPYQIFSLRQRDPYSKQRFYELVKLYHPDRSTQDVESLPSSHPCHNIPHSIKLERYRLIVAAHGILSDPAKRRAYDVFGAGWNNMPEAASMHERAGRGGAQPGPFSGWREHTDPNIWANATWEDWERFYARQDPHHPANHRGAQVPLYVANSYFVTVILVLALLGSTVNYGRAESSGGKFLEARDAMHDRASKELRRVRQQSGAKAKEERIEFFLRQREATLMGVGIDEVRQERLAKMLPEQDTCMSEDVREKDWSSRVVGELRDEEQRE